LPQPQRLAGTHRYRHVHLPEKPDSTFQSDGLAENRFGSVSLKPENASRARWKPAIESGNQAAPQASIFTAQDRFVMFQPSL
jgi:hypothetical protein